MTDKLQDNTVQQTLCIPLWGRMLATQKFPNLFPDYDAERIVKELRVNFSDRILYKMQYVYLNCAVRQYDFACEIRNYLKLHPKAAICELGAGFSTLRRQMKNGTNPWYNFDMSNVIALREKHIPAGANEHNIACDLNDFSWHDRVDYNSEEGIVFVAGGLFYYFEKEQVKRLLCTMADHFNGGMVAFDATNAMGLKGVNKEVKMAGNKTKSFFSLENPKAELEAWSPAIQNVVEQDYMRGYLANTRMFSPVTQIAMRVATKTHTAFIVHAEFGKGGGL